MRDKYINMILSIRRTFFLFFFVNACIAIVKSGRVKKRILEQLSVENEPEKNENPYAICQKEKKYYTGKLGKKSEPLCCSYDKTLDPSSKKMDAKKDVSEKRLNQMQFEHQVCVPKPE